MNHTVLASIQDQRLAVQTDQRRILRYAADIVSQSALRRKSEE